MNELQAKGYDVALKKSKIHQKGLMHLIKEELINQDIDVSLIDKFEYFLNVNVPVVTHGKFTFKNLLDEPRLKTYFEIFNNRNLNKDNDFRFKIESELFNKVYDETIYDRPKYGSLNITLHPHVNPLCISYGSKVLFFKSEIKQRTSFVYGDSFNGQKYLCTFKYPNALLYHMKYEFKKIDKIIKKHLENKNNENLSKLNFFGFIEAQIHGNIDIGLDVEKITLPLIEYERELQDILIFKQRYPHIEIVTY